jgi:hypothetical protein
MSETRMLLAKITALRQRLEQAQGLADEARSAAAVLLHRIASGDRHDVALEEAVRPVTGARLVEGGPPRSLTQRARRVLERGRDLLGQLRPIADVAGPDEGPLSMTPLYRDTVAMIDVALRTVALLPDSATAQMQMCRGLEATLEEVAGRLATLTAACSRQRHEEGQVRRLASALSAMNAGGEVDLIDLHQLAAEVIGEAANCVPMGFLDGDPADAPHSVACHSLTAARVLARIVRHDADLRPRAHEAVLAALLHDAGMLAVPAIVSGGEALQMEERRAVEAHALAGARMVAALFPDSPWMGEGVAAHHERLDGSGYPDGSKGVRIQSLARLLAVCDVYAALCTPRPRRPARSTRTAMADVLLLAEQGQLDHHHAECLLSLSFYPTGSVVELSDGSTGVVVATPGSRNDLNSPARPVVALLTDSQGKPECRSHHLDLSVCDHVSVVRALPTAERHEALGRRLTRWAA